MAYKFGKKSKEKLGTAHADLQLIMEEAIKVSEVDFGINEGHRSEKDQLKYFLKGYSKIDPRVPKLKKLGKHLYNPSLAVDIKVYIPDSLKEQARNVDKNKNWAYDKEHLCYVAGVIMTTAKRLYEEKKVKHKLRWGGNWDRDGLILFDHSLHDYPHFELIK